MNRRTFQPTARCSTNTRFRSPRYIRADGRMQLDVHAEITTEDGKKIALAADGVLMGAPLAFEL